MNRIPSLARPCALLFLAATFAMAQEPAPEAAPTAPAKDEIHELRQAVEQQNRQLEALTRLVTEIRNRLPASAPAQPATPAPPSAPEIGTATPTPTPPATPPSTAAAPSPSAQTPKPETAGAEGSKHTVAKGETLTSIAKRYNIPLAELEKANKITDERKLQIGQVLNIPTAANKTPETPTEKKETP